ncbi:MAG: tetratricopeptide repeat protein [Nostoc sp.]|uniref:tetratricopeptide repeat protein n=1 Tax=Nostoc sp. TaxID=1180 RepID=UPI002FF69B3C
MTTPIPYYISRKQAQDFLAKFTKALEFPESNPLLSQVYGFGGVGKTTLIKKLKETHELQVDFVEVSFGLTAGIETPLKLMEKLYELLPKPTGLWRRDLLPKPDPFTSLYEQYQETVYKLKTEPVQGKSVDTEQQNTVKDWFELGTATLLATGAGYLGDHGTALSLGLDATVKAGGMLSDASQALKPTKERIQELLQQHPATKNDKQLQELMLEPIPKLTHAFAQGLIQKTQKHKRSIVLVLDTYEKASSDIDTWLWQYLLEDTPLKSYSVRILVAGRRSLLEKESWRKLQQDRDVIYEQRLDEFNKEQTKEYLQHIGFTKSGDIQKIYKTTQGLPYYLNWIRREKEAGRDIDDFSRGNKAITDLLLQGLNANQKQIVQLAACCRWFDRSLIQYLMQKQGIDFETGVHASIDCFDWLTKCDFVEFVQGHYRLDDVARNVFRLSFCNEDRTRFRETHELLATYFEQQANQEVAPDSPDPEKYDNYDWRQYTAEFLYHALFGRRDEGQRQFLSHFFASRYLKQIEVVMIPFAAVVAEAAVENYRLLPDSTNKFLKSIKLGFFFSWMMLPENPAKYEINYENLIGPSKEEIEAALRPCFTQVDFLEDGLGKYTGLLSKSLRSQANQQVDLLQRATEQAEKIANDSYPSDPEFSSSLFLNLGDQQDNLARYEEALVSYNKALIIQDDNPIIYFCQGNVLGKLGRYEEALNSYDKALQIKDDYGEAWNNRGSVLAGLERYQEALASFNKVLVIKDDDLNALKNITVILMSLHSYKEVITICDQVLKIKSDATEILSNKGLSLSLLGCYDEALANLNEAIKLQPEHPLWWANQGIILARAGRYQDSLISCEKALELQANDESGYYGKACYFALQNDVYLAIENLQQAININPSRCRIEAKINPDFDSIRDNVRFQALLQG